MSGTAVKGWNQCRRTMWCDLRIGWRGNFIENQGHLWVERIVWFSCCLFVLIYNTKSVPDLETFLHLPFMISDSIFMVVEETISKYHKIFCIFVIFFFVRSAENQKSLSNSSSSSISSSFFLVCLLFLFIFLLYLLYIRYQTQ